MTAYQYKPLLSPDSIRLLVLQPSASHDVELRGSLLCTTLAEADYDLIDPYTALSYVWGSDERPCLIFLDGKGFAITQSLHDALRDMRDTTRVRRIWADALCINQDDVPERNMQVQLMGKVYGIAASTIIYFGRLTEDAAKVFSATTWRTDEVDNKSDHEGEKAAPAFAAAGTTQAKAFALAVAASRDLLSRSWFKRVWVLQELVFSKDPWIQCGRQRVRWNSFCRLLIHKPTSMSDEHRALLDVLHDMNEARNSQARGVGKSLWDVLKMRRGLDATDPRDYIFANLGIIHDLRSARKYVTVDYEDSVQAVFTKLATYIIATEGKRKLFEQIHDMHPDERRRGLPSWVPDWQSPAPSRVYPVHQEEIYGRFHVLDVDGGPSILAHTGSKMGTIDSVSAILPFDRDLVKALLATEEYINARQALLRMYDDIFMDTKLRKAYDVAWDEDWTDLLKERASQHESLCKTIGRAWVLLLEALDQQSDDESSGDESFAAEFSRWMLEMTSNQRALLDYTFVQKEGATEKCICYGIPHLLQRYLESKTDDDLPGRRLAITDTGRCAVVPNQARKGDVIIYLCDPTRSRQMLAAPLLTVRGKEIEGSQRAIDATIMQALLACKQPDETPDNMRDMELWLKQHKRNRLPPKMADLSVQQLRK